MFLTLRRSVGAAATTTVPLWTRTGYHRIDHSASTTTHRVLFDTGISLSAAIHARVSIIHQTRWVTTNARRARLASLNPNGTEEEEEEDASSALSTGGGGGVRPRSGPARVLIFDQEAQPTIHIMSRAEVLRLTQDAAFTTSTATKPPRPQRGDGATSSTPSASESSVIDVQRVHARDIRQLDSAFAVPSEPSVEVRDQAILVNADPVRAIVMRHRCLVFLRHNDATVEKMVQEVFHDVSTNADDDVAYEFQALEALLGALCAHYQLEFDKTAPMITSALKRLALEQPSVGELNSLRSYKNTMNEFQSRVDGVRRALMATLNNEEDMRLLYLTKLHQDRSLLGDLWSFDSEEAEVLIENYLQDIYATQTRATLLQQRIQNTESVVKLRLDAMRNYLLGVNIMFSVAGISLSMGTFTVGVFGMNLISGMEQANGMFAGVTLLATVLMATTGYATMKFFKRKGIFGPVVASATAKVSKKTVDAATSPAPRAPP